MNLTEHPHEILVTIFRQLPIEDRLFASTTCTKFLQIMKTALWEDIFETVDNAQYRMKVLSGSRLEYYDEVKKIIGENRWFTKELENEITTDNDVKELVGVSGVSVEEFKSKIFLERFFLLWRGMRKDSTPLLSKFAIEIYTMDGLDYPKNRLVLLSSHLQKLLNEHKVPHDVVELSAKAVIAQAQADPSMCSAKPQHTLISLLIRSNTQRELEKLLKIEPSGVGGSIGKLFSDLHGFFSTSSKEIITKELQDCGLNTS